MGLRGGVVLRETEPGHCGIYLLTTAGGNGFVGRYLRAPAPCGLRVGWLGSNVCFVGGYVCVPPPCGLLGAGQVS